MQEKNLKLTWCCIFFVHSTFCQDLKDTSNIAKESNDAILQPNQTNIHKYYIFIIVYRYSKLKKKASKLPQAVPNKENKNI